MYSESAIRRAAAKAGYQVIKSRDRQTHMDNFGEFQLVDSDHNFVVLGARFDASLADIRNFVAWAGALIKKYGTKATK